jgi:DNA adenine methylase
MATLTPFRYPGAKNKILPVLNEYIDSMVITANSFCDAFVGGGSVLLSVANRFPEIQLLANDKDYWVYCFWKVVASSDTSKLTALLSLMEARPTVELFYKLRERATDDEIECAYRAIFFNRCAFSGILSSGPIGGKEQKSKYTVDCRYNYKKLKAKILHCNKLLAGRTTVSNKDFKSYINTNSVIPLYLDPPYYQKGDSLYIEKMSHKDHVYLADMLAHRSNWVLSYDDCPEVRGLYVNNQIIDLAARYCINGKKDDWKDKNELIILSR